MSDERGLRIGSFAGAPIIVESSVLLLAAYMVGSAALNEGVGAIGDALQFVLAILIAVLLHEFGHAGVASALKLSSKRIVLTFFGGHVEFEQEPRFRWQEIAVSAAGPIVNLLTFPLALFGARALVQMSGDLNADAAPLAYIAIEFLQNLAYVSLWLGAFNLLPGFPLDGGRIVRAALSYVMSRQHAALAAGWLGLIIALALVGFALWQQWLWTVFIGGLLAVSAWAEIRRAGRSAPAQSSATSNA